MIFKGLADKAKDLLASNAEKVEQAVDKVGDVIDEKTGGKFAAVVDKAQEVAKGALKHEGAAPEAPAASEAPKDGDEAK